VELPTTFYIVGMPGSGKTTFGKFLAEKIGYSFFDLDAVIAKGKNKPITEIFENSGEQEFRKLEAEYLRKVPTYRSVISTGGGTPCFYDSMDWMNEHGFTIWLNPPLSEIVNRVSKQGHRPLIKSNPVETLREMISARSPYYEKAALSIHSVGSEAVWAQLEPIFNQKRQ
jgi:shikimate kinase